MIRILILAWLLLTSYLGITQIDTSVVMDNIIISETNARSTDIGSNTIILNSRHTIGSIAQLITQNSNTYIKNYGAGSLSTFSIRGGSTGQSLVLWNGLPLHSPMLGLLDLSLIPSNVTDKVTLTKGGSSAIWGSGAVSGVLSLESKKDEDYTVLNTSSIGSFGTITQDLSINLRKGQWHSTSKYIHESSDRDFEYTIAPNVPPVKQTNAAYKRNHFVQDLYFNPNNKSHFAAHFWAYKASTEIPPTTVQNKSVAYQEDAAIRSMLSYKYFGSKSLIESKIGYFNDHNDFYDSAQLTEALNRFDTWFADINGQMSKGNHIFSIGSTLNYTQATSKGYNGSADERKLGIFSTYLNENDKFQLKTTIRQEFIDEQRIPLTPNLAISYKPYNWARIHMKVSRDFRTPTLNDRNWKPGGNKDLLPESGWSEEIGLGLNKKIGDLNLKNTTTLFYRDIKNWILWSPGQDVPYWSAQNVNNVVSKGLEQDFLIQYKIKDCQIVLNLGYNYISSAYQTALTLPKVEAGDQLLYTPIHNGRASFSIENQQWVIHYNHSWTGLTQGVNETLPSYHVGNIKLGYNTNVRTTNLLISLNVFNILDQEYFIVERRPIAGINYNLGITIKY